MDSQTSGDTVSDDDFLSVPYEAIQTDPNAAIDYGIPKFIVPSLEDDEPPTTNVGDAIDNAIQAETPEPAKPKDESITRGFGPRRRKNPGKPKGTAPDVDEWLDFFSRIVIRFTTEWYTDWMFRGIDEDSIADADLLKLTLTEEERDIIARPYAEFANKNPFLKKHGRQIVAFSDSFESTVILGRFFMRVNRVARKYKPQHPKPQHPKNVRLRPEGNQDGNIGQSQTATESTSGPIPDGYPIYNPGGS